MLLVHLICECLFQEKSNEGWKSENMNVHVNGSSGDFSNMVLLYTSSTNISFPEKRKRTKRKEKKENSTKVLPPNTQKNRVWGQSFIGYLYTRE